MGSHALSHVDRTPCPPSGIPTKPDPRGDLPRGLGRSFGDADLSSGGTVWLTERLDTLTIDASARTAVTGAGVSYRRRLEACVPLGLFPPVTPGTQFVTIIRAIAADVLGKIRHKDGCIRRVASSVVDAVRDRRHGAVWVPKQIRIMAALLRVMPAPLVRRLDR